jgi:phosphoribosylformylglycinamidine cyclo-ligase
MPESSSALTYRDAGVDIDTGAALVERIKPFAAATNRTGVLAGLGGFGALFELPLHRYRQPVLVSGTDGVGTKLLLAQKWSQHAGIGIDLVAMSVNDILVQGAEPLFFLDYFATGKLELDVAETVIRSIAEGCTQAGCALVGGETAEMPGMYAPGEYDLAGFAVGIVEKDRIIDGSAIQSGDVLLGIASSGPHANGYSLIRRIVEMTEVSPDDLVPGTTSTRLANALLEPTQIYVKPLLRLLQTHSVRAMAHITGGGLTENLPRVAPHGMHMKVDRSQWTMPPIFRWLQDSGSIEDAEMLKTFNCGIGMVVVLPEQEAESARTQLLAEGLESWVIGEVFAGDGVSRVQY